MNKENPKTKTLTLQYVNKVKIENADEFEASLFEEVYHNACKLTQKIILDNEIFDKRLFDPDYSSDEQLNNIIAFLGGRGMGKSSAMFSFALFLKNYNQKKSSVFSVSTLETTPVFSVLPRIDASMMIPGENIMDIVLAKMWDVFERKNDLASKRDIYMEDIKEHFRKVQQSYRTFKKASGEMKNMTSVRELHDLAVSLNLRESFKKLVKYYLQFHLSDKRGDEQERFLVISIDDLDIVTGDIYNCILEQIRLFLMIPKVIVLVTADMDRLTIACNKQFKENQISRTDAEDYERYQIRTYSKDYLSKLFPVNMRIYMPTIGTIAGVQFEIALGEEHFDERKLMLVLMAKYSNIFYPPFGIQRFFLQKRSLRDIVHTLYILIDIERHSKDQNRQFDLIYNWYFMELTEYSKEILDLNVRYKLLELLELCAADFNYAQLNQAVKQILLSIITAPDTGYDYGNILLLIDMIQTQEKIYNFICLAYSSEICKLINRGSMFYHGHSIFYSLIAQYANYNRQNGLEKIHSTTLLELRLEIGKKPESKEHIFNIIQDNLAKIVDLFKLSYLCDGINLWNTGYPGYNKWNFSIVDEHGLTKEINQIKIDINDKESNTAILVGRISNAPMQILVSMDLLFIHAAFYKEYICGFLTNIFHSLAESFGITTSEELDSEIENITNNPIWNLEKYKNWKAEYHIVSLFNILPLESVDLMYTLAKNIVNYIQNNEWNLIGDGCSIRSLSGRLNHLIQNIQKIEEYYQCEVFPYQKYSEKLSEYLKIIDITSLSPESKKKLDSPIQQTASPSPTL